MWKSVFNTSWLGHRRFRHWSCWGTAAAIALTLPASFTPAASAQNPPNVNQSRPTLRVGSEGAATQELQGVLRLMGYYSGSINGVYDRSTANAVTQFQQAAGLSADGVVGIDTWNRLFPPMQLGGLATPLYNDAPTNCNCPPTTATTAALPASQAYANPTALPTSASVPTSTQDLPILSEGDEGSAVVELQILLQDLGLYQGAIDGMFGSRTADAVEALQYQYGLSADRVVGPRTWGILLGY